MNYKLSGPLTRGGKVTPVGRIVLRGLAVVFIAGSLIAIRHEARMVLGAEHAEATVIGVREPADRPSIYQADIRFTAMNGAPVEATITLPKPRRTQMAQAGETFPVMYSRDNVRDAVPLGRHAVWPTALIFTAVGILCAWISRS